MAYYSIAGRVQIALACIVVLATALCVHSGPIHANRGLPTRHTSTGSSGPQLAQYSVSVARLNGQRPIMDSQRGVTPVGSSAFTYNYNVAVVPQPNSPVGSILIRTQNLTSPWGPYNIGPSRLALSQLSVVGSSDLIYASTVSDSNVVFEGEGEAENYGTEDPRVVYREKTGEYILLYTAVQDFHNGTLSAKLAMATTKTPWVKSSWVRHGPVFPEIPWSKSGALLLRDDVPGSPHYLIFGDSSLLPGIQMAISYDLKSWNILPGLFLKVRSDSWDSALVESGPMPLRLSDGNYLFLYNSARGGFPSKKPGYQFQYNLGFLILDGNDPTKILQRSDQPILSPVLDWETGTNPNGLALVPNVVFCEGWERWGNPSNNAFNIYYGGADSVVGAARLTISNSTSLH